MVGAVGVAPNDVGLGAGFDLLEGPVGIGAVVAHAVAGDVGEERRGSKGECEDGERGALATDDVVHRVAGDGDVLPVVAVLDVVEHAEVLFAGPGRDVGVVVAHADGDGTGGLGGGAHLVLVLAEREVGGQAEGVFVYGDARVARGSDLIEGDGRIPLGDRDLRTGLRVGGPPGHVVAEGVIVGEAGGSPGPVGVREVELDLIAPLPDAGVG